MEIRLPLVLAVLGAASLCACTPVQEYRGPGDMVPPSTPSSEVLLAQARASGFLGEVPLASNLFRQDRDGQGGEPQQRQDPQDPGRQMIYTATMTLEVARVEDAIDRCLARIGELGGYLSNRRNSTLTFRVPADRFDGLLEELRTYGRVLNESMQAQDVTRQYQDLGIRLDNARRSRERLLALLEQAEAVEDMLKIENELRRLTEEIERMEGELRYLTDQVAMSTVSVTLQAVAAPGPPDGPRRPSRFSWINLIGAEHVLRWF